MTDFADQAAEREAIFLAESLHKAMPTEPPGVSAYECEDCGDEIPEARRQAVPGCTRCIYCQEYFERGWP
jgi:phage/conjugal plasmid C-4 type zinc finger TraR family protein